MLIVNKDRNGIINIANITNIYIGADGCTIKAEQEQCEEAGMKCEDCQFITTKDIEEGE